MKSYIFAILIFASLNGYAQPKVGEQVQEIALKNVNGEVEKLSDLRGKLVLIDFWASWCGPCRRSNKDLVKLYSKFKAKGFEIYGISIDDSTEAWKKAIASDKITWKQVNEPGGWETSLTNAWKIDEIPSSFLLDKEGKLIARDPSPGEIERYLKKKQ